MQRDEHNRICDVNNDEHHLAYLIHYTHSKEIVSYVLKHIGCDEMINSRGVRMIVHSWFNSICQNGAAAEDMSDVICRGTTASIPPA